jgi:hypothetical protein
MTDDLRFDTRLVRHRIRRGEISHLDLTTHLAGLSDDAERGEDTTTQFVATFKNRDGQVTVGEAPSVTSADSIDPE